MVGVYFVSEPRGSENSMASYADYSTRRNDKDVSKPRYLTVAEVLRKMIYSHELEPGEKIPSIGTLYGQTRIWCAPVASSLAMARRAASTAFCA